MRIDLDFSYQSYGKLLRDLIANKYGCSLIGESKMPGKLLYLRHDVDIDYLGVLPFAAIEHSLGLRSTWYFMPDCPVYNLCSSDLKRIVRRLAEMGHQIGLHIDATQYENLKEMISSIESYYEFLSSFLPISRTLSFHRPASWLLDDVSISNWANAYQKEYFSEVIYVSDSNRREFWKEDRMSMAINENTSLTLLTHPLWWKNSEKNILEIRDYVSEQIGRDVALDYLKSNVKLYGEG